MTTTSVLFDAPGPRTVARHRAYTVIAVVGLLGVLVLLLWRLYGRGQLDYELWEPFVTPAYMRAILVDGLLTTLQMAVSAVLFAVVFGLVFGVASSPTARGSGGPAGPSWSSSGPSRCCC